MRTAMKIDKEHLAERLRTLCADFRFTPGQPAQRSDGVIDVSVDRLWDEQGQYTDLVTVFAGFPPGPEVQGLVWTVRLVDGDEGHSYTTDHGGQFCLGALDVRQFKLRFEAVCKAAEPDPEPKITIFLLCPIRRLLSSGASRSG